MKKQCPILALLALLAFAGPAAADFYQYTDSAGELHFVDDIAKVPKKYRKQLNSAGAGGNVNVVDAPPTPSAPPERIAQEQPKQRSSYSGNPTVEVYLTSWCGYCKRMVRFLNEKGIPYTAYDIDKDPAAARTHKELGGRGVPVVRIGTKVVHGFNPDKVMSYYNSGGK